MDIKCKTCGVTKDSNNFTKEPRVKTGFCVMCKSCKKAYYEQNKHLWKKNHKKRYEANKDAIIKRSKERYEIKKEEIKKSNKARYHRLKEKIKIYHREKYKCDKDKVKERVKKWKAKNKDKHTKLVKKWLSDNKEYYRKYKKEYVKRKKSENPLYKLRLTLRSRITASIKNEGYLKRGSVRKYIGADYNTVKQHLEKQFKENMNWDNHGAWHIDHIKPLSSAKNIEELEALFHYTNLQPLWAKDNLIKSNKILN